MESNIPVCIQRIFLVGFHEFKCLDGIRVLALRTSDESPGSVVRCFTQVNHSPPATSSTKVFPTQPPRPTATTTSTSSTCLPKRLSPETLCVNASALVTKALVFFSNTMRELSPLSATSHGAFLPVQYQRFVKNHTNVCFKS